MAKMMARWEQAACRRYFTGNSCGCGNCLALCRVLLKFVARNCLTDSHASPRDLPQMLRHGKERRARPPGLAGSLEIPKEQNNIWRQALPSCCASLPPRSSCRAALLFAVQPMFTKMVLPRLGGSPVGVVGRDGVLPGRAARRLCLCASADPLRCRRELLGHRACRRDGRGDRWRCRSRIAAGWGRPPTEGEAIWLLGLFTVSIGLPFFALSANGPLLQAWFARTDHPRGARPVLPLRGEQYRQLRSRCSAYPFVIEPFSRLGQQTRWLVDRLLSC